MIILDSDVLIEIIDRKSKKGDKTLNTIVDSEEDIGITALNLHEVLYGLQKYAKPVKEVLQLPVLSYTKKDAALSAEIELYAENRGTPINRTDAIIAAITMNNGALLFTFNTRHFKPLENIGLKLFHDTEGSERKMSSSL